MTIDLSPEVLKTLPEPDANGNVRCIFAFQVGQDGEANVSEINDVPVTDDPKEDSEDDENSQGQEDEDPGPSAQDIDSMVYSPGSGQPAQ